MVFVFPCFSGYLIFIITSSRFFKNNSFCFVLLLDGSPVSYVPPLKQQQTWRTASNKYSHIQAKVQSHVSFHGEKYEISQEIFVKYSVGKRNEQFLSYLKLKFYIYSPWERLKTSVVLTILGNMEKEHWHSDGLNL